MSGYASANIDGTIEMSSIKVGVTSLGAPLATFRVCAGLQSHPTYATGKAALDVMAYAEAARRFNVPMIIVNVRAQLVSAESVTIMVVAGSTDGCAQRCRVYRSQAVMRACCARFAAAMPCLAAEKLSPGVGWAAAHFHSASGRKSGNIRRFHWTRAGHRFFWGNR